MSLYNIRSKNVCFSYCAKAVWLKRWLEQGLARCWDVHLPHWTSWIWFPAASPDSSLSNVNAGEQCHRLKYLDSCHPQETYRLHSQLLAPGSWPHSQLTVDCYGPLRINQLVEVSCSLSLFLCMCVYLCFPYAKLSLPLLSDKYLKAVIKAKCWFFF